MGVLKVLPVKLQVIEWQLYKNYLNICSKKYYEEEKKICQSRGQSYLSKNDLRI